MEPTPQTPDNPMPAISVEGKIYIIRGEKVMFDSDLAELYQVETRILNQAVKRNIGRFPTDFMFQLTNEEELNLRSQFVASNYMANNKTSSLRSQSVILKNSRGTHKKYVTNVFAEQGIAMLSSVLRSERAILVNIQIMRTFTKMRHMLLSHADLKEKIEQLEKKYDGHFKIVFQAIQQIMSEPETSTAKIGFDTDNSVQNQQ